MASLCYSNSKRDLKLKEKCQRKLTSRVSTNKTNDRIKELISLFQSDKQIQDEKITSLETNQQVNNETLNTVLGKIEDILLSLARVNTKIDSLSNKVNDLNKTLAKINIKQKKVYSL